MQDKYRKTAGKIIDVFLALAEYDELDEKTRYAIEDKITEVLRQEFYMKGR